MATIIALDDASPEEVAHEAGLRYVHAELPGIRRVKSGRGFRYVDSKGTSIHLASEIDRIRSLAIPPAWTDVWISPFANGHIQATGRDARGRKQYRYHRRWREVRDATKYDRAIAFGEALPSIRKRIEEDLTAPRLTRNKVLAAIVRLLDATYIRIGNEEYARGNKSFGLTTMRSRHVEVDGTKIRFEFRGKSGKIHSVSLRDRRLARIIKQCQDLPGYELFQYLDEEGNRQSVESSDVNEYIRSVAGDDFSAKDFRTWAGTVLAAKGLRDLGSHQTETEARRLLNEAIDTVAAELGNTRTICRNCYIHPEIISAHLSGTLMDDITRCRPARIEPALKGLAQPEIEVLSFLRWRLGADTAATA